MQEVPKILVHLALPKPLPSDADEALLFAVHPRTGELVLQVVLSDERLRSFSYARPASFPIPRDAALTIAREILEHFAPEVATALERVCIAARLRVVEGGSHPGGHAA